jgi:hypothetical protein
MSKDKTQALATQSVSALSIASRLAERTLAERGERFANQSLAERISTRLSARDLGKHEQAARIAAFVSELQITIEAAPPGAWFPLNLRRGEMTIPFEDRTGSRHQPRDIELAIRVMATAHAAGWPTTPHRAERVRAHQLLGEEGFDYLVSVIGLHETQDWAIESGEQLERNDGQT